MKKHCTFLKKSLVIAVEMLAVLGIVGLIWFLTTKCIIVTEDKKTTYGIDPFEDEEFKESYSMSDMFEADSAKIVYYLALCQQFETEGKFDEQKTIDVLEYYYRKKSDSVSVNSEDNLVYKIQDLINWGNSYGVSRNGGAVYEEYHTVDGISVQDMDLWAVLEEKLPGGVDNFEFATVEDEYEEGYSEEYVEEYEDAYGEINVTYTDVDDDGVNEYIEETITETYEDEVELEENTDGVIFGTEEEAKEYLKTFLYCEAEKVSDDECQKGLDAVSFLNEAGVLEKSESEEVYKDVMAYGSYEGNEIPFYCDYLFQIANKIQDEERQSTAQAVYGEILETVIYDLCYNYEKYMEYKDYFVNNQLNFKYLYLPENSRQYYSNLNVKDRKRAEEMASYFNEEMAAHVVIDPATRDVVERSDNVTASSLLPMLNQVGYSFEKQEGLIYLGVIDGNIDGFAEYTSNDHYAVAQSAYEDFNSQFEKYMGVLGVLALIALIAFVLYTCMCGNKAWYEVAEEDKSKKLMVAEKPCAMKYFDSWFTEIAFGVAVTIAMALMVGFVCGFNLLGEIGESGNRFYYMKNTAVLVAILVYAAICNGLFLFFYGSLIRRIKLGVLWKGSLFVYLLGRCKSLFKKGKTLLVEAYFRRGVVAKLMLSYVPVLLANFILNSFGAVFLDNGDVDMAFVTHLLLFALDVVFLYYIYKSNVNHQKIIEGIEKINGGDLGFQLDTKELKGDNLRLANAVNNIGNGIKQAVETSMKDERLKADLITNVSHDIKTPLTSIINYVDLLKREDVQDEAIREYIDVLDVKSQRLKQLTEDLVEASKISSGNITLFFEKIGVVELMNQIIGEFSEKFEEKELDVITNFMDKDAIILADGRRMWRVFENLFGNIYKYAMPGTRVYVEVYELQKKIHIAIKNISAQPLNIDAEELTERFIRGDISRSTEGSGLGLSIAKSLVLAQKGEFKIYLDGDLFKATIVFSQETEE